MSFRNAAKRDANEPEIVAALQAAGWSIFQVGAAGFPDLVVVRRGVAHFLEVKSAKGDLTPAQVKLHRRMAAAGLTVHVVRTPEEALLAVAPAVASNDTPPTRLRRLSEPTLAQLATSATLRPIARPVCAGCSAGRHEERWDKACTCPCHTPEARP